MPNWDSRNRSTMSSARIAAAYLDDREDELLDAAGTASAPVDRADGAAESVERCELLDFVDRHELLRSVVEILDGKRRDEPCGGERRCRNTHGRPRPQRGIARTGSRD
jgi:hypothetical protein